MVSKEARRALLGLRESAEKIAHNPTKNAYLQHVKAQERVIEYAPETASARVAARNLDVTLELASRM